MGPVTNSVREIVCGFTATEDGKITTGQCCFIATLKDENHKELTYCRHQHKTRHQAVLCGIRLLATHRKGTKS